MNPNDQKPETGPGNDWEQDLELLRSALSGPEPVEPPDLLDQTVLNTARRELSTGKRKPMRWIGAFATAAVVVLALTIVLQQDKQAPKYHQEDRIKQDSDRLAVPEKEAPTVTPPKLESPSVTVQASTALRKRATPAPQAQAQEHKPRKNTARIAAGSAALLESHSTDTEVLDENNDNEEIDTAAEYTLTADSWVEHMLELLRTERYEELNLEKAMFRKTFPDYALPPELQD